MKCKNCNAEMILDDKDFSEHFIDTYYTCGNCFALFFSQQDRSTGEILDEEWFTE